MREPVDIAKLLTENINQNNGLIESDDPRLHGFNDKSSEGSAIIHMKRGTVIEANRVFDHGGYIVWAAVGPPQTSASVKTRPIEPTGDPLPKDSYRLSPIAAWHPDAYKTTWMQLATSLRGVGGLARAGKLPESIPPDVVYKTRLVAEFSELRRWIYDWINGVDPADKHKIEKHRDAIIAKMYEQAQPRTGRGRALKITTQMIADIISHFPDENYTGGFESTGMRATRGYLRIDKPYGRLLSIKRENIAKIDYV